jgi:excisionase family DNA binding protein
MARRYNFRRVKIHRNYTPAEIGELLGVHKHTVGRWIASGLPLIDLRRPYLIHGTELRAFLAARQPRRHPLQPGEMFCLRCRVPRRPAGDMADLISRSESSGKLSGICPDCETIMHRAVSLRTLEQVRGNLAVALPRQEQRLADSSGSLPNVALRQDSKT